MKQLPGWAASEGFEKPHTRGVDVYWESPCRLVQYRTSGSPTMAGL